MGLFNKRKVSTPVFDTVEIEKKVKEKKPMTTEELDFYKQTQEKEITNSILRVLGLFTLIFLIVCLVIGLYCLSFGSDTSSFDGLFALAGTLWHNMLSAGATGWEFFQGTGIVIAGIVLWIATVFVAIWSIFTLMYAIRDLFKVIKHFFKATGISLAGIATTAKESVETIVSSNKEELREEDLVTEKKSRKRRTKKELFEEEEKKVVEEPKVTKEEHKKEVKEAEPTVFDQMTTEELDKLLKGEISEEDAEKLVAERNVKAKVEEVKPEAEAPKSLFDDGTSDERRHE